MATIATNGVSLETIDYMPAKQKATMDLVSRVLVEMATWNTPTYVKRSVKMTKSYYKEEFEVVATFENEDRENETMVHLIRTISDGIMKTVFARKHIFSVTDYEKYEEKQTDEIFTSDHELFGINLIKRWREWDKVAKEIITSLH